MKNIIEKIKLYQIIIILITLSPITSFAQQIKLSGNPSSIISSTAEVPSGQSLFFTSGFTASAIKPHLAEGDYEKYGDTETQALNILNKIKGILEENKYSLKDVFSMKVYVSPDSKTKEYDFAGWNKAYKQFFGTTENPNKPVRATVGVATLVSATKFIEIEVIAAKQN